MPGGNAQGGADIEMLINTFEKGSLSLAAVLYAPDGTQMGTFTQRYAELPPGSHALRIDCTVRDPQLWEPGSPFLYRYAVTISCNGQAETVGSQFGFRDFTSDGPKLLLNGRPFYARGILHWGYYDDEIIPKPSDDVIDNEINLCKQYGFNMIKHCLYIPRKEYLDHADRNGMLLWIELPLWIPNVTPQLATHIRREYPRLFRQIAGHPSVVMLSLGCELDSGVDASVLKEMYTLAKSTCNVPVRDNSGSGECYGGLSVDFADFFDYHFYADLQNMENLLEVFTPTWRSYRPWLFGEFCDSDTLRSLAEIREKKGVKALFWEQLDAVRNPVSALKPDFFAHLHDEHMKKSGISREFELLKRLSINHSLVHRKTTIEMARSFPEVCGYNVTCLRDVPIATSGLFDDFMQPKFDYEEVRRFNADIVLLPAWDLARIWLNSDRVMNRERYNFFGGEPYTLHILLSNYSNAALEAPAMEWRLLHGDQTLLGGKTETSAVFNPGDVKEFGFISLKLPAPALPQTCMLSVTMLCGAQSIQNEWPVFIYPKPESRRQKTGLYDPANVFASINSLYSSEEIRDGAAVVGFDVVMASRLTPEIKDYVRAGGKAFYIQRGGGSLPVKKVAFWREGMIRRYPHQVLDGLGYEEWLDDLRFFSLSTDTAFQTDQLEKLGYSHVTPIIRRYDCREWDVTDYMAEIRLGKGTIIATTLRFEGGMGKEPLLIANNRFAVWLLDSVMDYFDRSKRNSRGKD